MKKPYKIQVFIYAMTLVTGLFLAVRQDSASAAGENEGSGCVTGYCQIPDMPYGSLPDHRNDSGNIYADTPQFAVPRNTSVSSQPRQHSTAKRTGYSGCPDATLKDGKVITWNSYTFYLSCIDLFPSGTRDFKTRFLSLRKLII